MKKIEWIWSLLDKTFFHLSPSDLLDIVYIAIVDIVYTRKDFLQEVKQEL